MFIHEKEENIVRMSYKKYFSEYIFPIISRLQPWPYNNFNYVKLSFGNNLAKRIERMCFMLSNIGIDIGEIEKTGKVNIREESNRAPKEFIEQEIAHDKKDNFVRISSEKDIYDYYFPVLERLQPEYYDSTGYLKLRFAKNITSQVMSFCLWWGNLGVVGTGIEKVSKTVEKNKDIDMYEIKLCKIGALIKDEESVKKTLENIKNKISSSVLQKERDGTLDMYNIKLTKINAIILSEKESRDYAEELKEMVESI